MRYDLAVSVPTNARTGQAIHFRAQVRFEELPSGGMRILQTASTEDELRQQLTDLWKWYPEVDLVIDPHPGTVYGEAKVALDAVLWAGFTDVSFAGEDFEVEVEAAPPVR